MVVRAQHRLELSWAELWAACVLLAEVNSNGAREVSPQRIVSRETRLCISAGVLCNKGSSSASPTQRPSEKPKLTLPFCSDRHWWTTFLKYVDFTTLPLRWRYVGKVSNSARRKSKDKRELFPSWIWFMKRDWSFLNLFFIYYFWSNYFLKTYSPYLESRTK